MHRLAELPVASLQLGVLEELLNQRGHAAVFSAGREDCLGGRFNRLKDVQGHLGGEEQQ